MCSRNQREAGTAIRPQEQSPRSKRRISASQQHVAADCHARDILVLQRRIIDLGPTVAAIGRQRDTRQVAAEAFEIVVGIGVAAEASESHDQSFVIGRVHRHRADRERRSVIEKRRPGRVAVTHRRIRRAPNSAVRRTDVDDVSVRRVSHHRANCTDHFFVRDPFDLSVL